MVDGFECIDIHQAKTLIEKNDILIIDARDPASYQEAHIKDAVFLTQESVENFIQKTDKEKPLLCYCYHGQTSQSAALFFMENGFKKVYSMDGGFEAWRLTYPAVKD